MDSRLQAHEQRQVREYRRLRAWTLYEAGWKQCDIAEALGVSNGAVSQWLSRARLGGSEALLSTPPKGAAPRLTPEQKARLVALLDQGAEAHGFRGNVWERARVAKLIETEFGVHYHISHLSKLLKRLRYSLQKPVKRAVQRDEAAITKWREERWPATKKGQKQRDER